MVRPNRGPTASMPTRPAPSARRVRCGSGVWRRAGRRRWGRRFRGRWFGCRWRRCCRGWGCGRGMALPPLLPLSASRGGYGREISLTPLPPLPASLGERGRRREKSLLPQPRKTDRTLISLPLSPSEAGRGGRGVRAKIALILAGNTPLLSWSPLAACLLAGHTVHVKMSRDESLWPRLFRDALAEVAPEIAERVTLDVWPGDDPRTIALIAASDAVIAYGSDETIATLRALTPTSTPFFGYGYGVSVGILPRDVPFYARGFAQDVLMYGQAGCLSPQALLVETETLQAGSKPLPTVCRPHSDSRLCNSEVCPLPIALSRIVFVLPAIWPYSLGRPSQAMRNYAGRWFSAANRRRWNFRSGMASSR